MCLIKINNYQPQQRQHLRVLACHATFHGCFLEQHSVGWQEQKECDCWLVQAQLQMMVHCNPLHGKPTQCNLEEYHHISSESSLHHNSTQLYFGNLHKDKEFYHRPEHHGMQKTEIARHHLCKQHQLLVDSPNLDPSPFDMPK